MYTNGEGVRQDDAEAVKWAAKAAEQLNVEAMHMLGFIFCCRTPRTIPADYVTSYMWFTLAQQGGDLEAAKFLAMLEGEGMKKQQIVEARGRADAWLKEHGRQ